MATYTVTGNVGGAKSAITFTASSKSVSVPVTVVINDSLNRSDVTKVLRNMAERLRESNTVEPPAAYT